MKIARLPLYSAFILFLLLYVAGLVYTRPHLREYFSPEYWRAVARISQVMQLAHRNFVDAEQANYEALKYSALSKMVTELDEYSEYMEAKRYEDFSQTTEQTYVGIGIQIERLDERVTVTDVFMKGSAEEAGLLPGDQIISVGGEDTLESSLSEAVKKIKGEEGSKVAIGIYRPLAEKELFFEVERRSIEFPSVRDVELGEGKLGYLRLTSFGRRSATEFTEALDQLEKQGMQALIFDLRDNPGGLLPVAVEIAGQFIEKGKMVVSTRGRTESDNRAEYSESELRATQYPIAILINNRSASASEIVSGALQDYEKAIVIGETSVGKGSVQSVYSLEGGDGLRMTTAMYYLPSGRTIHKKGVEPDVEVIVSREAWIQLLAQRSQLRYLSPAEFESQYESPVIVDPQLEAAREALIELLTVKRSENS